MMRRSVKEWLSALLIGGGLACAGVVGGEPLSIAEAVQKSLAHSPHLRSMRAGERVAAARIDEARAMRRPKVGLSVTESTTNSPLHSFGIKLEQGRVSQSDFDPARLNDPSYTENLRLAANVVVPVWLGGMDRHAEAAARAGVAAAEHQTFHATEQVIFGTIRTYLGVILAREAVKVADQACAASAESVANAQAAVDAQRAVESDLIQARVHHADNEERRLRARNQLALAQDQLATQMGVPSARDFELTLPLLPEVCTHCGDDPTALLATALRQRPDHLELQRQIAAMASSEKMHRGALRPQVVVGAGAEQHRRGDDGHGHAMVFAQIDFPLTDGGAAAAKAAGARHTRERLAQALEASRDRIHLELREAVININNALERIRVSREAVELGQASLAIIRNRYNAGMAIMSELLMAETALFGHQMNHIQALYEYAIARAAQKLALGELTPEHCDILQVGAANPAAVGGRPAAEGDASRDAASLPGAATVGR